MSEAHEQIDFKTLLPFSAELDGSVHLPDGALVTCYRVLLTFHQLMSDVLAQPQLPRPNRVICRIMRHDLDRALLAMRTINDINAGEEQREHRNL